MEKILTVFVSKTLDRNIHTRGCPTCVESFCLKVPEGPISLVCCSGFESGDQAMSAQQQQQATKRVRGTPTGQTPAKKEKKKTCLHMKMLACP